MAEPITYLVAAQAAFANEGHAKDIAFRKAQLHILRKILTENEDRLYEAIYKDFRKSRFDTFLTELSQVYSELSVALKNLEKWSRPKRVAQGIANFPGNSKVIPEPLGHTLIIGAWNYPYNLTLVPVISAIAAGNT